MSTDRQAGGLLLEMMFALTIFTVGVLGFLSMFRSITTVGQDLDSLDRVQNALRNAAAALRHSNFANLYTDYDGRTIPVPDLEAPGGGVASVQVSCYVDETALPPQFGPVADIDGDGVLATTDCSSSYEILPVRLRLVHATGYGSDIREVYILVSDSM